MDLFATRRLQKSLALLLSTHVSASFQIDAPTLSLSVVVDEERMDRGRFGVEGAAVAAVVPAARFATFERARDHESRDEEHILRLPRLDR